jgi:hypothetical protein
MNLTLHNAGSRPVTVRFRPESLRFGVMAPTGADECAWPTRSVAAMRELYSTVRPGANASLSVLLSDYCGGHVFDEPGLLVVTPRLDTARDTGEDIGIHAFVGEVTATIPTLVRLRKGRRAPKLVHPHIEGKP